MARGVMPRRPAKSGRHEGAAAGNNRRRIPVEAKGAAKSAHFSSQASKAAQRNVGLPSRHPSKSAKGGVATVSSRPYKKNMSLTGPEGDAVGRVKASSPTAPDRIAEILRRLNQLYPDVTCALTHRDPWELLVATILSAQSTDVRVNMVTPELFKKYPALQDFAKLEPEQLEPDVRSTGFFRNKSKSVVGAARAIVHEFGGKVPEAMDELLTLPGVARKTANVVLGTWFGKAEGVVVDTHVHRISRRLELTKNDDPKNIEQDLMRVIPREKWILFSHQIIWHGRKLCFARSPKCIDCPLENICYAEDKTWSTVEKRKGAKA
jgi:endonuclease III